MEQLAREAESGKALGMWIDYAKRIEQSEAELRGQERRRRGRAGAERLKVLRLLKSGTVGSLGAAATVVGYSERQVQRWWQRYRVAGLAGLLEQKPRGGRREPLTPEVWAALTAELAAGRVGRLKEVQAYLEAQWGIRYTSLNGVSRLFQRHKVKLKTGRRRHRRADPEIQAAFKKGVRGDAAGGADKAGLGHG